MIQIYNPVQRLYMYLANLGIIAVSVDTSTTPWTVTYDPSMTPAQVSQGNLIVSTWDTRIYQTRPLLDLVNAINVLTAAQKTNISNDLFGGTPLKALLDDGANVSAIFCLYYIVQTASMSGADKTLAKLYAAAMYCQDNPMYLINPSFDTSINVPGWSPLT